MPAADQEQQPAVVVPPQPSNNAAAATTTMMAISKDGGDDDDASDKEEYAQEDQHDNSLIDRDEANGDDRDEHGDDDEEKSSAASEVEEGLEYTTEDDEEEEDVVPRDSTNNSSNKLPTATTRLFESARTTFQSTQWRTKLPLSASEGVSALKQVWRTTSSSSASTTTTTPTTDAATANTTTTTSTTTTPQQLRATLDRYKNAVASSTTVTELLSTAKTTLQTAAEKVVTTTSTTTTTTKKAAAAPSSVAQQEITSVPTKQQQPILPPCTTSMLLGKGMLGVNLKPTFLPNQGVYVDYLVPHHAAEISGQIKVGDLILSVGDHNNTQYGSVVSVPAAIAQAQPRPVKITLGKHGDPAMKHMPIHHIDLLIALVYRNQPTDYQDVEKGRMTTTKTTTKPTTPFVAGGPVVPAATRTTTMTTQPAVDQDIIMNSNGDATAVAAGTETTAGLASSSSSSPTEEETTTTEATTATTSTKKEDDANQEQVVEPTTTATAEPTTTTDSITTAVPTTTTEPPQESSSSTSTSSSSLSHLFAWSVTMESILDRNNLLVLKPVVQSSVPTQFIHQRVRSFNLDDVDLHTALRNALLETVYDGRRRDFFARYLEYEYHHHHHHPSSSVVDINNNNDRKKNDNHHDNNNDVHKYLLLAAEILAYHEFSVDPWRFRPHKIYHHYLAPTALLDCHGICADAELRNIERWLAQLDNDQEESSSLSTKEEQASAASPHNPNLYNSHFVAALEQLETAFYEFCQSPDCARMRAYLRGTKPPVKLPLTDIVNDPYQFNFCLVHAMTIGAASDLCGGGDRKNDNDDHSKNRQKYISTQAFAKFRSSVYHEYMLQGMSVTKLLRLAEFPPHVSVHKPMIVDDDAEAKGRETAASAKGTKAELAQAVMLLRGETAERATREMCETLRDASCDDEDLEVPLQVESYAWSSSPLALIDFCVPRAETGDSLYGVSLSLESKPPALDDDGGSVAAEMTVMVLLSTRNTILPMREALRQFHATHGTFDVDDLKGQVITILKKVADDQSAAAASNGTAAAATPEDLFLTRSGEWLIKSLTPIPLALVFLAALLEQKIIFLSSRRSLLLAATTVLKHLLRPLEWCHLLVPMVPPALIHDLLQYPAPFLLGLESSNDHGGTISAEVVRDLPKDVTLVDLDVGRVILGTADDELRPSLLAAATRLGTKLGRAMDPETWRCDDVLLVPTTAAEPSSPPRCGGGGGGFAALAAFCHDFCHDLVANTTGCCYRVGDTILFDESSFACGNGTSSLLMLDDEDDKSLQELFLRSQAMNRYIGTRRPEEMRC